MDSANQEKRTGGWTSTCGMSVGKSTERERGLRKRISSGSIKKGRKTDWEKGKKKRMGGGIISKNRGCSRNRKNGSGSKLLGECLTKKEEMGKEEAKGVGLFRRKRRMGQKPKKTV